MVYHIMPSSIVLLKSYTPAVLLLILPLPNFSAMCIFPQGQVWEVAEWVAQSGWVVIVETETEVLQLNRDIPPHAKHRKQGNTDGSYGVVLFQLSSCLVEIDAICIFTVKAQTGWKCVRRNDGWF